MTQYTSLTRATTLAENARRAARSFEEKTRRLNEILGNFDELGDYLAQPPVTFGEKGNCLGRNFRKGKHK